MSPLSIHYESGDEPKPRLETWCYFVGFASLIPFLGLLFACVSVVLGIAKIGRRGGWSLLVLAALGFALTSGLTAVFYDQIFPPQAVASVTNPTSGTTDPAVSTGITSKPGEITWLEPAEGLKMSKVTGKPILYDFTAHWCGWCKILDAKVFQKPEYAAKINGLFVPVVVMDMRQEQGKNSDDVAALQSKYSVRGYPTLV
ncbi:MAG TPA: thioredoxin fold domain-containing protein, partial [bacterium]|nr:thioredoxin fold domain-containing protein [bacterium]